MIRSQGYWMELECSDKCGATATITSAGKIDCIKEARNQGWSLSQTSHSCWCPECAANHTARAKTGFGVKR